MMLRRIELTLALVLAFLFTYAAAVSQQQNELAGGLLRLHVVANSDSPHDQQIKLQVRDAVLEFCQPVLEGARDRAEVQERLEGQMQALANHAQQTLWDAGEDRSVTVRLAEEYYPTRDYPSFSLPAGNYLGLRVTIGEGVGHNWWCVVFPPLCKEAAAGETLDTQTPEEELKPQYSFRFKTAEVIGMLRHQFFSNPK